MEKPKYWEEKLERKEKSKRRPEGMSKKEWEEEKKKNRQSKTKSRLEVLKNK